MSHISPWTLLPSSVIDRVHVGDWLASIDLTDAYLHIPIHMESRRFLRFTVQDIKFQFKVLPFGLNTAPCVFTKVLGQVVARLHLSSVYVNPYLDDWLLRNPGEATLATHVALTQRTLQSLGFLINHAKSQLKPVRELTFLGMQFDTRAGLVSPSLRRCEALRGLAHDLRGKRATTIRTLMRLIGQMTSMRRIVPQAALRSRPLQRCLLDSQRGQGDLDKCINLAPAATVALLGWEQSSNLLKGVPIDPQAPALMLITDACCEGWGGHLMDLQVQGQWSQIDKTQHINWLELKAVFLSLQAFQVQTQFRRVLLRTDNTSVVAYINKEGGTRSPGLSLQAEGLILWCIGNGTELSAHHLPGVRNGAADALSRRLRFQNTEWQLSQWVANQLFQRWPVPLVDLFATRRNTRLRMYVSFLPDPQAVATDALSISWKHMDGYAFPPFPLIQATLEKVRLDPTMTLTLVAPKWPVKAWFPLLLSLLVEQPLVLPDCPDILSQADGSLLMSPALFHLHAWRLSSDKRRRTNFLAECPRICLTQPDSPQPQCTNPDGDSTLVGMSEGVWILAAPL
jgi:hypothetical protein